jgi:hypothetical protein
MDKKSQKSQKSGSNNSASFEDAENDNYNFEDCNDLEPKGKLIHIDVNFLDSTADSERKGNKSQSVYVPEDTSNQLYAMEIPDESEFLNN